MPILVNLRPGLPNFDLQQDFEGTTYTLRVRWNVRAAAWFLDVLDEAGETYLVAGRRMAANWPTAAYVTGRAPAGALVLVDTAGLGAEATFDDLGTRHLLYYYSTEELGLPAPATV